MTAQRLTQCTRSLDDQLPTMTYRDLSAALKMVAVGNQHVEMIPYFVSALQQQAPFLTGELAAFEILRSANCLADIGPLPQMDA